MNIVFVQTGNYAPAYHRVMVGEPETYRGQTETVNFVAGLAGDNTVTTITLCDETHDVQLAPGLRSVALPRAGLTRASLRPVLDDLAPDRIIIRFPCLPALQEARARRIPTFPIFADLFQRRGLRGRLQQIRLRRALSGAHIPCVSNHSVGASTSVVEVLGLPAAQVVPWDWAPITADAPAKARVANPATPTAFYAGALSEDKGVGDCLHALRLLQDGGIAARMSFAGGGNIKDWQARAAEMGVSDSATFLGLIPNDQVRARMGAHDMVIVPSRHSYPEGMPKTISEGLASRSPLIISDHPAFKGRFTADHDCLVFQAGAPEAIADAVARLCDHPGLYAALSQAAEATLGRLSVGVEWSRIISLFLDDPTSADGWVAGHSLPKISL